jgi:hypothetical protein
MTKKLLNATIVYPYSPDGTFNLAGLPDKCIITCVNGTLWSRLKVFLSYLLIMLIMYCTKFRQSNYVY